MLLFDEPSEGLAPILVDRVVDTIKTLRAEGISAILVEQNLHVAVELADRVAIMTKGDIVFRGTTAEFRRNPAAARVHLGLA